MTAETFEGDVVDVGAFEQSAGVVEAFARLLLTEDGLAEEVHVEAGALGAQALNRWAEFFVSNVNDEVADETGEDLTGGGHCEAREETTGFPADQCGGAQVPGEELRVLVAQFAEVSCGDVLVLRADDAVDEGHGVVEAVLIVEDACEEFRCRVDRVVR